MSISLPAEVQDIIKKLNDNSFEAYIVGGCVRDSIIGKTPKDWDITTNATPPEIKSLFDKTIDTGIKHGTVTVVINSQNFEVTTYRIDGRYSDNRRPEKVEFTSSLTDDLSRRDFTINAIAYHPVHGFVDPFSGAGDIEAQVIRTVGDPDERFKEDALRMLRAVRFSAQLGFPVDPRTFGSIRRNSALIVNISRERIRDELTKILVSANPEKFELLRDAGLLAHILPEFEACFTTAQHNPFHIYDVARHTLKSVSLIEGTPVLRWTMLLHDIGKPLSKSTDEKGIDHFYGHPEKSAGLADLILRRLKFDTGSIIRILKLVRYHDRTVEASGKAVRKEVSSLGADVFTDLLKVKEADIRAQNPVYLDESLEKLNAVKSIYANIEKERQCLDISGLAVSGDDLLALGFTPGRHLGKVLSLLLEEVLENPENNKRECLLATALKHL